MSAKRPDDHGHSCRTADDRSSEERQPHSKASRGRDISPPFVSMSWNSNTVLPPYLHTEDYVPSALLLDADAQPPTDVESMRIRILTLVPLRNGLLDMRNKSKLFIQALSPDVFRLVRKLVLVVGTLSLSEMENIVQFLEQSPLLAEIEFRRTNRVDPSATLPPLICALVRNPLSRLRKITFRSFDILYLRQLESFDIQADRLLSLKELHREYFRL